MIKPIHSEEDYQKGLARVESELLSNLVYSIRRPSCLADRLLVPHL